MGRIGSLGLTGSSSWAPMDLFRFTASGQRDFSGGRDGLPTFFSADGTNINTGLQFHNSISSSGQFDGFDLADWDGVGQDANDTDPFGPGGPGVGDPGTLSATDIQILEALGWNPPASTPTGTSADMIMVRASTGDFEIFNIGQSKILSANHLTQIGSPWVAAGVGDFNGTDAADIMLRNSSTGALEVEDVSNDNAVATVLVGQVGSEWSIVGFGDFSTQPNETDMMMRNSSTGVLRVFDINSNHFTNFVTIGQVGSEWSVAGFGDFSGNANETDMLMRDNSTGVVRVFDINNNHITNFSNIGTLTADRQIVGVGAFSSNPGETDIMTRNSSTGVFELFDVTNSQMSNPIVIGQVGSEWSILGFADFSGNPNETDMLMQSTSTGVIRLFDIANNQITSINKNFGQLGSEWSVAGIVNDPLGTASPAGGPGQGQAAGVGSSPQPMPSTPVTNLPGLGGTMDDASSQLSSKTSDFFNQVIAGFAPNAPSVGGAAVTEMGAGSLTPATDALGCITGNNPLCVSGHNPASLQT
jgi:hypothetical protein